MSGKENPPPYGAAQPYGQPYPPQAYAPQPGYPQQGYPGYQQQGYQQPPPQGYYPPPAGPYPTTTTTVTTATVTTERYCGPISCLIGWFLFPCICFCPIDERPVSTTIIRQ